MKTISADENFDRQISQAKFRDTFWRKGCFKWLLALIFFLLIVIICGNAKAGEWSYSGSVRYAYGNYIYTTKTQSYYFLSSLRYRSERHRLSLSLPVIGQNSSLIAYGGGGTMPRNRAASNDGMGENRSGRRGSSVESNAGKFDFAFGDLFLSGYSKILKNYQAPSQFTFIANYQVSTGVTINGGFMNGLSNTVPDFAIFAGVTSTL